MKYSKRSTLTKYLFLLFILAGCNQNNHQSAKALKPDTLKNNNQILDSDKNNDDTIPKFSDMEEKIFDTIFKLKEIKDRQAYMDQQTKGARHLQIWIVQKPNLVDKYYYIALREDNGTNYVTHFNFYVYPDSMRIMYLDMQTDTLLTLQQWRKLTN